MPGPSAPVTSLYVHVPFCALKCSYCAFYSEPAPGGTINRYLNCLARELGWIAQDLKPATIFFGGGTPSILNLGQWEKLLGRMHELGLKEASEWTVECNPATVSLDKARLLRSFGINRISMGVQSFDDSLLERLGRIHTRDMVFRSWENLRRAGFDNLNLDLMFAIPGQSMGDWRRTLDEAIALQSEHLSCYEVIYEEDTALFAQLKAGKISPDEDLACLMYEELVSRAASSGYQRYEIANFARETGQPAITPATTPRLACRHNLNYWLGGDFYGAGPSATGYVRGRRTKNWSNTQLYCEQIERGRFAHEAEERLTPLARAGETAAFGLRMVAGWSFETFQKVTGHDLRQHWADEMRKLVSNGWGVLTPDRFQLTPAGLRFADAAAEMFLR